MNKTSSFVKMAAKLVEALGVSLDYLVGDEHVTLKLNTPE
ncbi:hypothetical protein OKW21_005411 [Catalinimonas alkaloidigena]|nr:hypothetical protein [Catalinimonas alkaloidigena]